MPRPTAALMALALAAAPAHAQEMVPATLAGHAAIPADTMSAPPEDAPRDLFMSGKFTRGGARVDAPGEGLARNGLALPFLGQPLQGISGYATARDPDGAVIALIDNGFGRKGNSPDAMLSFVRLMPDFETGEVEVLERVWLRDPDRAMPYRLSYDDSAARYLTGGDFDPESIQVVGDAVWIGEEFGPFLIRATMDGRITDVIETEMDGEPLRAPGHPRLGTDPRPGIDYRVPRSGGFEGMGLTPSGGTLWAMLEKPLLDDEGAPEGDFLRVLAFDPEARAWTGEAVRLALTPGATAIGDLTFVDETRALVIERDGGQGDPSLACPPDVRDGCFRRPAEVKRVTLVDFGQVDADGFVARLRQIDLMDIADPDGLSRLPTDGDVPEGRFTFPFVTIESVMRDGPKHILVGNDNNLPFSAGRALGVPDANEMIRLHVPELLAD